MSCSAFVLSLRLPVLILVGCVSTLPAQIAKQDTPQSPISDSHANHVKQRAEWFLRGRVAQGKSAAELRRRAYQAKLQLRAQHAAALAAAPASAKPQTFLGSWIPLGPVPLASDATGNGTQDYHQVAGRATAVAIDPADPTGNTVYIGGAQSGVWKSTNAISSPATSVSWTPVTDDQPTLSIGAIAIQPGNTDPTKTLLLAATGEADDSSDSYFGLGILRSTDAGNHWTLITTANGGALSFSGLGGARMAFSTASGQTSTVVAAMATTSEGLIDGAVTTGTSSGLYTSLDAGQTWTYDALVDPSGATDATSATAVVYNASAGEFFAAIRYHGFYSSPDGINWTRLATQPGGTALSTTACPAQSGSNNYTCPIYRAEITVVPGRNEIYVWYISLSSTGIPVDGGIWQSVNGGSLWNSISDTAIANCGDFEGCGVAQGAYNLELLAVPDGSGTDLYAGAINLYKCSINSHNSSCSSAPFINLTHAYGCDPIAAPAHVHPDQHALGFLIPTSGSDSGNALMYFANDGGIYRALDGFDGLSTGSCAGTNLFDDLNQNLGSMTQFVSFSQHPTDPNTLLGGAQGNGSPATSQATTNSAWGNVLGGDGGYNAIDPGVPLNFYASNPDVAPGGLGIQLCSTGVNCVDSGFFSIATSSTLGGDDGGFYFPYILDSQSQSTLLVGTCRVWRGPRTGGAYTALSPNFDTLGSGTCAGSEVNQVRALAAGGSTDNNGSQVIYATTSGLGPLEGPLASPTGGRVWVTVDATAGLAAFTDVTDNGPQGGINPNQFPIASVALDPSDPSGSTAYVTVMGFTGGPGHIWKTINAGAAWTDFTANLPDSPVNAVVVDPLTPQLFVGTDVGVFVSSSPSASWSELGPTAGPSQTGFLPDVAVTALNIFNSGGQELLRASTYGRGIWQFDLLAVPDFQLLISNSPLTDFAGFRTTFNGTASALNGYASSLTLSCVAGATPPPSTCTPTPSALPIPYPSFVVTIGGAVGDYNFNLQGIGSDGGQIMHLVPVTLHIVTFELTTPLPSNVTVARGTTSSPSTFQVAAAGSFAQSVTVSCNAAIVNSVCTLTPGTTVNPTSTNPVLMTASVAVPAGTAPGNYTVTIQASTAGAPATITTAFTLTVTTDADFILTESSSFPEVNAGSSGTTGPISIAAQDGFSGAVALSCPQTFGANSCSINPASVSSYPATATLTVNGTSFAVGSYSLSITGTSGAVTHTLPVAFNVGDYSISGVQPLTLAPGGQGTATFMLTSTNFYSGKINATCDASALTGATCTLAPVNPLSLASDATSNFSAIIDVPNDAPNGAYAFKINTQDSTGAPVHNSSVALTVGQDFLLLSSTASQTVNPGQTSGPYNLTIQPVGASFNSSVALSCSNLPSLSQCAFAPSTPVTPGTSAVNVVMTISTTATTTAGLALPLGRASLYAMWLLLPGIVVGGRAAVRGSNRRKAVSFLAIVMLLMLALPGCGGVSTNGGGGHQGTPPGTYQVTVTGTSSGAPADAGQRTQVSLVVN